jgi:hypothetical protein
MYYEYRSLCAMSHPTLSTLSSITEDRRLHTHRLFTRHTEFINTFDRGETLRVCAVLATLVLTTKRFDAYTLESRPKGGHKVVIALQK